MADIDRALSEIREAILDGLNQPYHKCDGCGSKKPVVPISLTYDTVGVQSELVQVAAVAVAWMEAQYRSAGFGG